MSDWSKTERPAAVRISSCVFGLSKGEPMEKVYYDAVGLERVLHGLEERHGFSSEAFLDAHRKDDRSIIGSIPRFERHTWASFYREWRCLTRDEFADSVEHTLELA